MEPCSRDMTNSLSGSPSAAAQIAFQELQNGNHSQIQQDDFFDQMLSALPSWLVPDGSNAQNYTPPFDESVLLASRLRQHQISGAVGEGGGGSAGAGGLLQLPLSLGAIGEGGEEGVYNNGFGGSLQQHFHHSPNLGGGGGGGRASAGRGGGAGATTGGGGGGGTAPAAGAAPRQRVRARRGQATDPHSIAERLRRERIAERMKGLQELVPNANKTDKASMLDEIIDYVKFLQLQVKVLSMSRLGGAAAVAPLVADISSEAAAAHGGRSASRGVLPAANEGLSVTEQQVAKLMKEDMGSAMQYLQGKGLCLMPISLASAISTATSHPRSTSSAFLPNGGGGEGPSSPSLSVLTVQSAVNGGGDRNSVKEAASVSKP